MEVNRLRAVKVDKNLAVKVSRVDNRAASKVANNKVENRVASKVANNKVDNRVASKVASKVARASRANANSSASARLVR